MLNVNKEEFIPRHNSGILSVCRPYSYFITSSELIKLSR